MLGGFLGAGAWPTMDLVAKTVLNLIAVGCMLWLKRRIAKRASA
jgi:hypothetical protein